MTKYNYFGEAKYISNNDIEAMIESWIKWIRDFIVKGWDVYMVTVLFHELAGSRQAKLIQMNQEIERIYNRLGTRTVTNTRAPKWKGYLPIGIFVPDYPVPKSQGGERSTIADVSINDGLHMGGIVIANRFGKITTYLESHFREEKRTYRSGKVRYIDVRRITHDVAKVADYTFKSLKRRTCTADDVLVLNWGGSELRPTIFTEAHRRFGSGRA